MAGSDLDGDLYFVTWHEELILKKENEAPMHFPAAEESRLDRPVMESDIIDQLKFNVESDDKGRVSSQHLVFADLHGIHSNECKRLAHLSAQMYDASKTGTVPAWPSDLRTKKAPDFLEKDDHRDVYRSERILGKLYRHSMWVLEEAKKLSSRGTSAVEFAAAAVAADAAAANDDDSENHSIFPASAAELVSILQQSYGDVMQTVAAKYRLQEVAVWRSRFPDFRFTEHDIRKRKDLVGDFRRLQETMRGQYRTVLRDLKASGISENEVLRQCKRLAGKPFCAGFYMMMCSAAVKGRTSEDKETASAYQKLGRTVLNYLRACSACRLLDTDCIQFLLDQRHSDPVYVFLCNTRLLAVAAFLAEHLCRRQDDESSLQSKLDCVVRVLFHVSVRLGLCSADSIARARESAGFATALLVKFRISTWIAYLLGNQWKRCCLLPDNGNDVAVIGMTVAGALWDIYTKRETSSASDYEDWELQLTSDAVRLLLKAAFGTGFGVDESSPFTGEKIRR